MKIFQTYYQDSQKSHLLPGLVPLDTRKFRCELLEYDIFRHLRHQGDFGVVSWKFSKKTQLVDWQEPVQDLLQQWDAVIINPFPGVAAVSYNCWQSHPSLIPYVWDQVDCTVFQEHMAFCSYIFAKKTWWDQYFDFVDSKLNRMNLNRLAGYSRNPHLNMKPFVIERLLNYCMNGAYLWQYPEQHYVKKFGDSKLYELQQAKRNPTLWEQQVKNVDFWQVINMDS